MDVTREHISRILELKELLLSFQNGFNLVNAVFSAWHPRQLQLRPDTLRMWLSQAFVHLLWSLSVLKPLPLFVIILVFSALISIVETLNYFFFLFCYAINVNSKAEIGDCSASNADSDFGSSETFVMTVSRNEYAEEGGWE